MTGERINPTFAALLAEACESPGKLSAAFRMFHNYSIGNAMAAISQCDARGLEVGPIATFRRWKELGRCVRKGSKAITLCMPVTCKAKKDAVTGDESGGFTRFIWRPFWFVMSQTDGPDIADALSAPEWDADRALSALKVSRVPFSHMNGNAHGYATGRTVAVSPLAESPFRTFIHELAHVVIGHTVSIGDMVDGKVLSRADAEVEAEGTAFIVCAVMNVEPEHAECSRGYVQHWLKSSAVTERMAARIFKTADAILKAGRPVQTAVADIAA